MSAHRSMCFSWWRSCVRGRFAGRCIQADESRGTDSVLLSHCWQEKDAVRWREKLKRLPLVYIPVSECKAWGAELEERAARLNANRGTAEDEAAIDEADPGVENPDATFIHYDPK